MKSIGVGMVGMGVMGEANTIALVRALQQYPELRLRPRLVAAADPVASREAAALRLGYERFTPDWRSVVGDSQVEVVCITTPNFAHREVGVAAAQAGKPFWIEKPVGRTSTELAKLVDAVREAGILALVGFNYRQAPVVQHARALLQAGEFGTLRHFRAAFLSAYASHPRGALSWRFQRRFAGHGVLGDLMSHVVDLSQHLVGRIVEVSATHATLIEQRPVVEPGTGTHFSVVDRGELQPVENEDWGGAIVRFESGLLGMLEASRVVVGPYNRLAFEANGSSGAISWDLERLNELRVCRSRPVPETAGFETVLAGVDHPDYAHFLPGTGLGMGYFDLKVIEAARFLESCQDGVLRGASLDDALWSARVIDAMLRSSQARSWAVVADDGLGEGHAYPA